MTDQRERYVVLIKGRYFWRATPKMRDAGFRTEPLGTNLEKANERAGKLNAEWDQIRPTLNIPEAFEPGAGTFEYVSKKYQRDRVWYGLKSFSTKDDIDRAFKRINIELGPARVDAFTAQFGRALYNKFRDKYTLSASEKAWKWFVSLMKYAAETGVIPYNPVQGMKIEHAKARSTLYTPEEVDTIIEHALYGGTAKSGNKIPPRRSVALATAIAYDTSMAQGDVLALTWDRWDGIGFTGKQQKERSGDNLYWPVSERTRELISDTLKVSEYVIFSEETRKPYIDMSDSVSRSPQKTFGRLFAKFRKRAGIKSRTFHDLRRTAMTEMGQSGATETEIGAMSGHKPGSRVLKNYVIPGKDAAVSGASKRWAKKAKDKAKPGKV